MSDMMACGHAANAVSKARDGKETPCCVICAGSNEPAAHTVVKGPDLTGRMMKCSYGCAKSVKPSSLDGAFFEHRPTEQFDRYYCGCFGWD